MPAEYWRMSRNLPKEKDEENSMKEHIIYRN